MGGILVNDKVGREQESSERESANCDAGLRPVKGERARSRVG